MAALSGATKPAKEAVVEAEEEGLVEEEEEDMDVEEGAMAVVTLVNRVAVTLDLMDVVVMMLDMASRATLLPTSESSTNIHRRPWWW